MRKQEDRLTDLNIAQAFEGAITLMQPVLLQYAQAFEGAITLMQPVRLIAGGDLRNIELDGPPTLGMWEWRYACLKSRLLMLGSNFNFKPHMYHDLREKYHERYGPTGGTIHIKVRCVKDGRTCSLSSRTGRSTLGDSTSGTS